MITHDTKSSVNVFKPHNSCSFNYCYHRIPRLQGFTGYSQQQGKGFRLNVTWERPTNEKHDKTFDHAIDLAYKPKQVSGPHPSRENGTILFPQLFLN